MSTRRFGQFIQCLLVVAAIACFGGSLPAQGPRDRDDDLLDRARRLNEITVQKMEADVRAALADAGKLAATDTERALGLLRNVLDRLEEDQALTPARRATLRRTVRDRINTLQLDRPRRPTDLDKHARDLEQSADTERKAAELRIIRRNLQTLRTLREAGRTTEASLLASQLSRRYPDNPAVQVAIRGTAVVGTIEDQRTFKNDRDKRVAGAFGDVDRSSLPPTGDVEFNRDYWRNVVSKRKAAGLRLTRKEEAILKALNLPVKADFRDARLEDVINYLAEAMGVPIIVDKSALEEKQITYDTQINFPLTSKVAARTVLRKILGDLQLAYIIKDETIQVLTAEKAKETMVTRAYPVGDLVAGDALGFRLGPQAQQILMMQNAAQIVDMIRSSVEPQSWRENGGSGSIVFEPRTMSLMIKQSAEVHAMLGSALGR